ncbi:DUF2188 domain-containing protein [Caldithrix abyssi]|nr:DUF2188 domain-containing protein [Caldithrix abyssi]
MLRKIHHVVPNTDGGWDIKKGGGERSIKHFDRKSSAVDFCREISRNQGTEFLIHGQDGSIQQLDSHRKDPFLRWIEILND